MHEHTQDPALAAAVEQTEKIRRAVSHLGKAVELGLIDVALEPQMLTEEARRRYLHLGEKILDITSLCGELLEDIAKTTGLELQSDAIEVPHTEEIKPLQRSVIAERAIEPPVTIEAEEPNDADDAAQTHQLATGPKPEASTRLYRAIVSLAEVPEVSRRENDAGTFRVRIVAAQRIQFADDPLWLGERELYIFNALLLGRDGFRSSRALRSDGFEAGRTDSDANLRQRFSLSLKKMMARFEAAAGRPVILKSGNRGSAQYMLDPNLELIDERPEVNQPEEPGSEIVKKN